jgi:hypothetical protein
METNQLRIGKYVIVKNHPILFPVGLAHSDVVNDAQSAGFFILRVSGGSVDVQCWGESIGLNIQSNGAADARIITDFMGRIASPMDRVPDGYPLSEV